MAFHNAIWLDNYLDYVVFLNDLSSLSHPSDYSFLEWVDIHPTLEYKADALMETHCYVPGTRDDVNLFGYMGEQFAWGKTVVTFYKHPCDDYKESKATKNTLGR
jgi:hypothetical protein